jgi:hypothetical protein
MTDELSARLDDLLDGAYDCVDRIVLNGYHSVCYSAGGFRLWWRSLMGGSEEQLDNAHLMRLAGRFSRRVRGFAKAHGVPVIDCRHGDRKHDIAEDYLGEHAVGRGLFLILVGRAVAPVWDVKRSNSGGIQLTKTLPYVNHYSFHIMDAQWGHITIKMAGHPPFGAQIILNGHEYVACQANARHLTFTKEGNCFTQIADAADLASIADTLSEVRTVGRLIQVCDRWIYSACLCFALSIEEQERTGFHYAYSVYQLEYSRNLLFHRGSQLEQVFQRLIDRTRARLDVRQVKTLFGAKRRPHWHGTRQSAPRFEVAVETLAYDLTVFKIHFGNLTLKAYTKGERVLRIEAVAHNTQELRCGRVVARFPQLVARLHSRLERFMTTLDCVDAAFIGDQTLDQLPLPARVGKTRVGGVDLNSVRIRRALSAVLALAPSPAGFSTAHFRAKVQAMTGLPDRDYTQRQAAYDLKKLRAKNLITKVGRSRRYQLSPPNIRAVTALLVLREHVIRPLIGSIHTPPSASQPTTTTPIDQHYQHLRLALQPLFQDLGIAA